MINKIRILIVEDDQTQLKVAVKIIKSKLAATISTASTLREAKEILKKETFDVILTDLRLPDTTYSTEAVTELKKITKAPIVVFSASYLDNILNLCLDAGAVRYLRKASLNLVDDLPNELKSAAIIYRASNKIASEVKRLIA